MNVQNSSVAPAILLEKVEALGDNAGELHSKIISIKSNVPSEFLVKYKELVNLVESFKSINSPSGLNSNAVVLADSIADVGIEITIILNRYQLTFFPKIEGVENLSEAAQDLKGYCKEILRWDSASLTKQEVIDREKAINDKNFEEMIAAGEAFKESTEGINTKLKKLNDTVDTALLRAEVVIGQQADSIRESLTREVSNITEGFSSTHQALKDRLIEFDGYREQATKLLSEMAAEALAGGHIESAKEEEVAANLYRKWALWAMIAGLCVIGAMLLFFKSEQFTWPGLVNRAMVSVLFVIPTAYLARESAKHRAQAIELRRASLDFAALEPFLKGLEGEEGLKVRAELARRAFFAGNAVDASSSYGIDPQAIIMKGMDTIADLAKRKP
ncbi:hypothetical protein [Comamonas sp.]|uniref:hypothetical protein n=1 Tax=Comamonas sp. TaxID=34028 RepID=UPI00289ACD9C|nr:hypothetical protein [Comamonas sp.]